MWEDVLLVMRCEIGAQHKTLWHGLLWVMAVAPNLPLLMAM